MTRTLFVILLFTGVSSASIPYVYHFVSDSKTWEDAQTYCTSHFTALAQINNMQNLTAMINTSTEGFVGKAWIGLVATFNWTWDDGQLATYFNWKSGQPDNVNNAEFCVTIANGEWNDVSCTNTKAFVCGSNVIGSQMTRANADSYCKSHSSSLAKITDILTNGAIWLKMTLSLTGEAWIGLQKTQLWHWSDVRETNTFRNWQLGQPDNLNQGENCAAVAVNDGTWTDEQCTAQNPFFCYDVYKLRLTVVRMEIQSTANWDDPASSDALLQQLFVAFANHGVTDIKLTWHEAPLNQTVGTSTTKDPFCSWIL